MILDAGTGIRALGNELQKSGARSLDLIISHPHIDHLQGFPFFAPAYDPGTEIRVHRVPDGCGPSTPFDKLMEAPHFPLQFRQLPCRVSFHEVPQRFEVGGLELTTHPLNHPGGNSAFRVEKNGKSIVYMTDHEPYSRMCVSADSQALDSAVIKFAEGADLLILDSQYTSDEYATHRGWGHSSFEDAISLAQRAEVKQVALFHHDPDHSDAFLEQELVRMLEDHRSEATRVFLAREGSCVPVG